MQSEIESYFINPPPDSAAARAAEFGIDLTLTLDAEARVVGGP